MNPTHTETALKLTRRMRRLRQSEAMRALVRETRLSPDMFVLPLFICEGEGVGSRTFVSGAFVSGALAPSGAFAGSVGVAVGVAAGVGAGATAVFTGSAGGAVAAAASGAPVFFVATSTPRINTRAARLPATMVSFFLSCTNAGMLSVTVDVPGTTTCEPPSSMTVTLVAKEPGLA